jgi:hypothetical protein
MSALDMQTGKPQELQEDTLTTRFSIINFTEQD